MIIINVKFHSLHLYAHKDETLKIRDLQIIWNVKHFLNGAHNQRKDATKNIFTFPLGYRCYLFRFYDIL